MESIAHIRQSDGAIQKIEDHLYEVKELAEQFGGKIGVKHLAGLSGLLHDMGKYSDDFKNYILEAVKNPEKPPKKGSVDHSTAGGKLLYEDNHHDNHSVSLKIIAETVGNAIISHHMGLQDFLTPDLESDFLKRVKEKPIEDFTIIVDRFYKLVVNHDQLRNYIKNCEIEVAEYLKKSLQGGESKKSQFSLTFLTKFVFSCLIDADRTNTRCFEENTSLSHESIHEKKFLFEKYYNTLTTYLKNLNNEVHSVSPIIGLRAKMSQECDDFAESPSGIYTLSIPTGGGKTIASLRYALKHAAIHKKDRIVYVIPYTTIIEQNAEEIRRILNDSQNILEHHSNIIVEEDSEINSLYVKDKIVKLAKDNWDAPIIFTTMVQFLNAFYSKGTRSIRRLHNLTNAVIIFDEVQSVPVKCISLFNEALNFLKKVGESSILLCTATQPALDFVKNRLETVDGEIVQNLAEVSEAFKRVEVIDKTITDGWNTEKLTDFIIEQFNNSSNILVILNTKTVVRKLFQYLKEVAPDLKVFHLSTSMCAAHRKEILNNVKRAIRSKEKVVCISTQLIEAGVDISFDCVIRSLAGLDSIAQAAGRCNRHGEHKLRNVYIINHYEENLNDLKEIKIGAEITQQLLKDRTRQGGIKELLSSKAMELYFRNYYNDLENELDFFIPALQKNMYELLSTNDTYKCAYKNKMGYPFNLVLNTSIKTAGNYFEVIANQTTTVIVPYEEGAELIAELNGDITIDDMTRLLKKAQQFTVNVYPHEIKKLSRDGNLIYLREGKILCLRENAYDLNFGVNIEGDGAMAVHFL